MESVNSINGSSDSTSKIQMKEQFPAAKISTINGNDDEKKLPGDIKELIKQMKQIMRYVEFVISLDERTKQAKDGSADRTNSQNTNAVQNAASSGALSLEVLGGNLDQLLQQFYGAFKQAGIAVSPPPTLA